METVIRKKVSISLIEKLFERTDLINIRYFNCIDKNFNKEEKERPFLFEIRIRHNEKQEAQTIVVNAIKNIQ